MADAVTPVTTPNIWYQPPKGAGDAPGVVNKNMFMQLLVAQLKNQDPLSPKDGTEFVGELAQFQSMEQAVNTGQDVAAIRADLDILAGTGKGEPSGLGS